MKTITYYTAHSWKENLNFDSKSSIKNYLKEYLKANPNIIGKFFEEVAGFCPLDKKGLKETAENIANNFDNLDFDDIKVLFEKDYYISEEKLILED